MAMLRDVSCYGHVCGKSNYTQIKAQAAVKCARGPAYFPYENLDRVLRSYGPRANPHIAIVSVEFAYQDDTFRCICRGSQARAIVFRRCIYAYNVVHTRYRERAYSAYSSAYDVRGRGGFSLCASCAQSSKPQKCICHYMATSEYINRILCTIHYLK